MIDQPDTLALFGTYHFPGKEKSGARALATKTSHALGPAIAGENTKFYFGLAELRRLAGETNRTTERQFATASESKSIDRADGRFADGLQHVKDGLTEK